MRPAGNCTSPICTRPRRNVPVVSTTAAQEISSPSAVMTPLMFSSFKIKSSALAWRISRLEISRSMRLHGGAIEGAIGLGARTAHRRTFAPVEQTELNSRRIRDTAHQAIQRIDLAHQMAFADAADRGIAGHLAQGGDLVRQEQGFRAGRAPTPPPLHSRHGRRRSRSRRSRSWRRQIRVWKFYFPDAEIAEDRIQNLLPHPPLPVMRPMARIGQAQILGEQFRLFRGFAHAAAIASASCKAWRWRGRVRAGVWSFVSSLFSDQRGQRRSNSAKPSPLFSDSANAIAVFEDRQIAFVAHDQIGPDVVGISAASLPSSSNKVR